MKLINLIQIVKDLREPDRQVEIAMGLIAGYRRKVTEGEDGKNSRTVLWVIASSGDTKDRIPRYTSSIDDAFELCRRIAPDEAFGLSYEAGSARAKVGGAPHVESTSPAIALCFAALVYKYRAEGDTEVYFPPARDD